MDVPVFRDTAANAPIPFDFIALDDLPAAKDGINIRSSMCGHVPRSRIADELVVWAKELTCEDAAFSQCINKRAPASIKRERPHERQNKSRVNKVVPICLKRAREFFEGGLSQEPIARAESRSAQCLTRALHHLGIRIKGINVKARTSKSDDFSSGAAADIESTQSTS